MLFFELNKYIQYIMVSTKILSSSTAFNIDNTKCFLSSKSAQ